MFVVPSNFEVRCEEKLEAVRTFLSSIVDEKVAEEMILNFQTNLNRLSNVAGEGKVILYNDFAPYSFTWSAGGMFGGLIYHGQKGEFQANGSVCITEVVGWSLHT